MKIDLSFKEAAIVLPREHKKITFFVIGAGGTGSYAAFSIARLAYELIHAGKEVELTIIDPDRVEKGNIPRSDFCFAEVGLFKAQTLAERISSAWGLEVGFSSEKLDFEKHSGEARSEYNQLTILVGCVDNFKARRSIHASLAELEQYHHSQEAPRAWWIDGGNSKSSGQVLIGSNTQRLQMPNGYFSAPAASICRKLPAPTLVHPDLLEPERKVLSKESEGRDLSCGERIRLGEQSLNINNRVAVEIGEILTAFLLTNSLKRFASYFDLESGTGRSLYCTPENIKQALPEKRRKAKA